MDKPILQLSGTDKSFGGVPALRHARFDVCAGEIHGIVGENGAGKSTLINVATGLFKPDSGGLRLDGKPLTLSTPRQAAAMGIAVVHQEADLFAQLSIAENMLLGRGLVRGLAGLIRWPETYREAERMLAAMGESFSVREEAGGLSIARRMMAEIAAAVSEQARVLFLDEPTSSLTRNEIENLFTQVRRLRAEGVGIVYVSHRLEEVLQLCDRVTVMRDGKTVETRPVAELNMDRIVAAMVGRDIPLYPPSKGDKAKVGGVRLRISDATAALGAFRDISFEVRAGEVVGLYGFVGAGRSELAQALFGLRRLASGTVTIDGQHVTIHSPRQAMQAGLAYLPEDRLVQGVFRTHPLRANASVAALRGLSRLSFIRADAERVLASRVVRDMNVRAESIEQPIGTLSGGNQQKVVFGRWQATDPKVLLLDEPTRGVDVGAKAEIHKLIGDMAARGAAVLLISSELPEIMAMSDRVVTLSEGRLTGTFDPKYDGEEAIAAAAVPRAANSGTDYSIPTGASAQISGTKKELSSLSLNLLRFREIGLLGFILVLSAIMTALKPAEFANPQNLFDILASAALPAIMAQGAMLIICAGGIDISIGSMVGLVAAIAALSAKAGVPAPVCLALAILAGIACSLLNAGTSLLARIHPIIVTLAGLSIYRGLMRIVTGGSEVLQLPAAYRTLANGTWFGLPKICYYVIAVTILAHVFLRYTLPGRRVLALGNSESAARLIGLSKTRLTLLVFGISGGLAGLTAVLLPGYYGNVQANTGEGMELKAIAAAVIGGTNILGGRGSALGTLLGAFLVALLYNVLILLEASSYWQDIFVGGLILVAVAVDALLQRVRGGVIMIRRLVLSREAFLLYVLVALFTAFALLTPNFLDWFSLFERMRYWVIPGLIAVPMTFIIATGGIDLSVGSIVAMCTIVLGMLYGMAHWSIALAAPAAVAVGFIAGAFNGGVSSYLRIPPLVVTLATMALFRGVAMGLSKARSVSNFPESFLRISQGNAFSIPAGEAGPIGVPIPLFALFAVVAAGALLMRRSWIGRFTECIGENETAARFAAIDVRRIKCALYTACGAVCGLAALFNTALYATAKADAATGMESDAIACVVIGGTRISGGQGSVLGSLLGLFIIGILKYGLERAGIKSQHVVIFVGGLLIVTAVFNEWLSAASGRTRRGAKS